MGLRGPQPKPASQKRKRGKPGHHPITDEHRALDVPASKRDAAEFPPLDHLSDEGKAMWERIVPELVEHDLMSEGREPTLALLINTYLDYVYLRQRIEREGWIIQGQGKIKHKNPAVDIMLRSQSLYLSLAKEFGLTPKSKAYQPARRKQDKRRSALAEWQDEG